MSEQYEIQRASIVGYWVIDVENRIQLNWFLDYRDAVEYMDDLA